MAILLCSLCTKRNHEEWFYNYRFRLIKVQCCGFNNKTKFSITLANTSKRRNGRSNTSLIVCRGVRLKSSLRCSDADLYTRIMGYRLSYVQHRVTSYRESPDIVAGLCTACMSRIKNIALAIVPEKKFRMAPGMGYKNLRTSRLVFE